MINDPNRPTDDRLVAELCLCRRRWLSLPLAARRRHWDRAARQLGCLSGIAGWVEARAWELAGIHRWQARAMVADPYVAADLRARLAWTLHADPLGQGAQEPPGAAIGASGGGSDAREPPGPHRAA